jgi:hypothetical protein
VTNHQTIGGNPYGFSPVTGSLEKPCCKNKILTGTLRKNCAIGAGIFGISRLKFILSPKKLCAHDIFSYISICYHESLFCVNKSVTCTSKRLQIASIILVATSATLSVDSANPISAAANA